MHKPYYQDDNVTIYHGDCRDILPELPKVDLVLTDPPYNIFAIGRVGNFEEMMGDKTSRFKFQQLFQQWLLEVTFLMQPNSWVLIFGGWQTSDTVLPSIRENFKVHGIIVWDKKLWGLGNKLRHQYELIFCASRGQPIVPISGVSDVWSVQRIDANSLLHIAEKPVALIDKAIQSFCVDGGTILDPFLGSGTTAYCAKKLGRRCIGIEIDEKYCEVAANRCRQAVMDLTPEIKRDGAAEPMFYQFLLHGDSEKIE